MFERQAGDQLNLLDGTETVGFSTDGTAHSSFLGKLIESVSV